MKNLSNLKSSDIINKLMICKITENPNIINLYKVFEMNKVSLGLHIYKSIQQEKISKTCS